MANLAETSHWLRQELPALLAAHQVPGAALAVLSGDRVVDHAAGVLNTATGVAATTDSVFQIGSITKVWTTSLAMQLVDEGRLDLDAPVRHYLPEFKTADRSAAAVTVRQLACHTAGFEGDVFTDTGPGDDCVERYVDTLGELGQLFPPGHMFSYNNAAFCVLGRVVEVLRGLPYEQCLRTHLFTPLGLTHAANGADEAILYRAAVGHVRPTPDAPPEPAPIWSLVRSNAPAGARLAMRPRDLLTFVRMHLDGGVAPDGTKVLDPVSVAAMRQRQVELPPVGLMGGAWGLGWAIHDWPGGPVLGHDGGTFGQAAFLRVVPDRRVAVALLTNGGDAIALYTRIYRHLLRELAEVEVPPMPTPPARPTRVDAGRYVGTYASQVVEITVSQDDDGRIWTQEVPKGLLVEIGGRVERRELVRADGDTGPEGTFIPVQPIQGVHPAVSFVGDDGTGRARYLHNGRANPRVEPV
ncbi:serine hydrolase domain-containing protein [Plantactinospora sonchi]|uniref:Serine hydrolase domain-containing protein n=1 Tax=Plantactinospora sonchi TaxID=1544735 RepID=A0ABU7S4T3_9ACTN